MKQFTIQKAFVLSGLAVISAFTSSSAVAGVKEVAGQSCPSGTTVVTYQEALQNKTEYCAAVGQWNIVRLANGASMDGKGYGCGAKQSDTRGLGSILCKDNALPPPATSAVQYVAAKACPGDYVAVTYNDALANKTKYCAVLGANVVARLGNLGSLSGSALGCTVQANDTRDLAGSLCKRVENTAYVEVNSNDVGNVGCFKKSNGDPLFQVATIFAANIGYVNGKAALTLNTQTSNLLNNNIQTVRNLQKRGIKVVLSILNDHQNAGWSCFADATTAGAFAKEVAAKVSQYGLDGIAIDDEYDGCAQHYNDSLVKVTSALRTELKDKIISKALFADLANFDPVYNNQKLGDLLTNGHEMTYSASNCTSRVSGYISKGVSKAKLGVGASTVYTSKSAAQQLNNCVVNNQLGGGMMIFNVAKDSAGFLQAIWPTTTVEPNCLK